MVWGLKGPPHFVLAKSYFFCYLQNHAQIQNRRQTPSGRKVSGRMKEKERHNNAKFGGHYVRSDQKVTINKELVDGSLMEGFIS